MMESKNFRYVVWAVVVVLISAMTTIITLNGVKSNLVVPPPPTDEAAALPGVRGFIGLSREDIQWAVIDKLTVLNDSELRGDASVAGGLTVAGNLGVTGAQATGTSIILEGDTADDFETAIGASGAWEPLQDSELWLPNVVTGTIHVNEATVPLIASDATIGGGWSVGGGGSGCTIATAGSIGCDGGAYFGGTLGVTGAVTMTGALTAPSVAVGGGWSVGGGGSGCTLSAAGGIGCDSTAYFGSTLGVTGAMTVTGNTDLSGTLQYGANDLYPIGHASSGKAIVAGAMSTTANGSAALVHGLTGIDAVLVTLCQAPTATEAIASAIITGTTVTVHSWQAATPTKIGGAANVCYQAIGTR